MCAAADGRAAPPVRILRFFLSAGTSLAGSQLCDGHHSPMPARLIIWRTGGTPGGVLPAGGGPRSPGPPPNLGGKHDSSSDSRLRYRAWPAGGCGVYCALDHDASLSDPRLAPARSAGSAPPAALLLGLPRSERSPLLDKKKRSPDCEVGGRRCRERPAVAAIDKKAPGFKRLKHFPFDQMISSGGQIVRRVRQNCWNACPTAPQPSPVGS